jgi:hypothetical protein
MAEGPMSPTEFGEAFNHPNLKVALEAYLAVHELLVEGGGLTRCLLGANGSEQTN